MRRLIDVYAQLAADRDHQARLCAELCTSGAWDQAAAAARKYQQLEARCDAVVVGRVWEESKGSTTLET
jgi:phage protein D